MCKKAGLGFLQAGTVPAWVPHVPSVGPPVMDSRGGGAMSWLLTGSGLLLTGWGVPGRLWWSDEPMSLSKGPDDKMSLSKGPDDKMSLSKGPDEPISLSKGPDEPIPLSKGPDEPMSLSKEKLVFGLICMGWE